MTISGYHRSRTWSSAYALQRIAAKRSAVEKRLSQINESVRSFEVEKALLLRLCSELDEAQRDEQARAERRGKDRQQLLGELVSSSAEHTPATPATVPDGVADSELVASEPTASGSLGMVERSMAQVGKAAPYDQERCLFVASPDTLSRSTRPIRIDVSQPGFDDPLMQRAVKLLETPGLLHMMVLAERSQVVIDPDSFVVPEASLGLPLADAYVDQVFSLEALNALSDPETANDFLAKVIRDEAEPKLR